MMSRMKILRLISILPSRHNCAKGGCVWNNNCIARDNKKRNFSRDFLQYEEENTATPKYIAVSNTISQEECQALFKDMVVLNNFLSEADEKTIFDEIEPYMSRLHYEYDHWDNAIHGFRETERLHWTKPNMAILDKVRKTAFPEGKPQLRHVHVLDVSEDGYIKPHIDSVKFCGDTIAGLSLLSDCVMRLVHDKDKTKVADVLLKRRSLYIMRDSARYDYTHEILKKDTSKFKEMIVPRARRLSVICRSEVSK